MKSKSIFSATGLAAAILAASAPVAFSQNPQTNADPAAQSASDESAPRKMTAALAPAGEDGKAKGSVEFARMGDTINVTGRVEGLEPMKTYLMAIDPAVSQPGGARIPPPSNAGMPDAGQPNAGTPKAPPSQAGTPDAGQPNGEIRSTGADTIPSATGVTDTADSDPAATFPAGDIAGKIKLVTDSTGGVNINSTLRNVGTGADGLLDRMVTIEGPAGTGMGTKVATGKITAASEGMPEKKAAGKVGQPAAPDGTSGKTMKSPDAVDGDSSQNAPDQE